MSSRRLPPRATAPGIGIAVCLLLLLPASGIAAPRDPGAELQKFQFGAGPAPLGGVLVGGFGAAQAGTTWFGGTRWDAVDGRYEAIQDSCWTFDSGVGSDFDFSNPDIDPFKDTSLHARMEGWIGYDNTFGGENPYFRRLDGTADWEASPCVGSSAGLGGSWSWWAGALAGEADALCYAAGQGYGNGWNIAIEQTFVVTPGVATMLTFDYAMQMEAGFDYAYAEVDTGGGDFEVVWTATGNVSGTVNQNLTPGIDYPQTGSSLTVRFRASSDGAYSDEDGLNATACGALAIDDVSLSGGVTYADGFEADAGGWVLSSPVAGQGGDWSNIVHLADLPPQITPCTCGVEDSVLVFEDITVGGHGLFQDNLAASPWIDLVGTGFQGSPGKVLRTDIYAELPLLNYIFAQMAVQWYPEICPETGGLVTSPWTSSGFVYYFGGIPACPSGRNPFTINFSGIAGLHAERIRMALGVISYCRFFGNCNGITNSTPWYDNAKFGFYGTPGSPFLETRETELPQDSWPTNGTLRLDSTGRVDAGIVKGDSSPEPYTALGDTLIVRGALSGAEVYVQFAVDPGPGIDVPAFNAWLTSHTYEGTSRGLDWYSARMDTSLITAGYYQTVSVWMTAYHELDPNFTGSDEDLDPNDLTPKGAVDRLANDIFPDDLFTPGTRLMLFYKAIHDGSDEPYTGTWYVHPDTAGGSYLEMEVLPSSAAADSTWNCILYVDHFDGRGGQAPIETALRSVLPGGSDNFENVPWDRYDVRAPSSQQASLGRPGGTEYGATVLQMFAYDVILWDSGNLPAFNLTEEDANVLRPWLALFGSGLGFNNLYLSGNDIAESMNNEALSEPGAFDLLENFVGATYQCATVRDASCPGSPALQDTSACIQVDPVGAFFTGNSGPNDVVLQGNGCPQLRSFDVLGISGSGAGIREGNEIYDSSVKGAIEFHSVANDAQAGPYYKTVIDGGAVHYRRQASDCASPDAIADRLDRVLTWFGYASGGYPPCEDIPPCLAIPDPGFTLVPAVLVGTPTEMHDNVITILTGNYCGPSTPLVGATVEIEFTPEADALVTWGPYQDHPTITAVTDATGTVRVPIMAGGCLPTDAFVTGAPVRVYADGILLAEVPFTSVDMVNSAGQLPGDWGWSPDCGIVVSAADASFIGNPTYPVCYDFDGDGDPGDVVDLAIFANYNGYSTCGITGTPNPVLVDGLEAASPNPFRGSTRFALSLAEASPVALTVYDVSGRAVRTLLDRTLPAGAVDLTWDGRDDSGAPLGPGLYFYRLDSPRFRETGKVVLLR